MTYANHEVYRETVADRSTPRQTGADLSTPAVIEDLAATLAADRLVPISEASVRLGRSVWTLKRLHERGHLPAFIDSGWLVPESFICMVFASMRPCRAVDFAKVAQAWFAAHGAPDFAADPDAEAVA